MTCLTLFSSSLPLPKQIGGYAMSVPIVVTLLKPLPHFPEATHLVFDPDHPELPWTLSRHLLPGAFDLAQLVELGYVAPTGDSSATAPRHLKLMA